MTAPGTRGGLARMLLGGFAVLVMAYLALPILVIVPMSFSNQQYLSFPPAGWSLQWYRSVAGSGAWSAAAVNSFLIGMPTALLAVVLGTLTALAVSRGNLRFASVIAALVLAPMMLPHVVIAIGLYPVMLRLGLLQSLAAPIIGHAVIAIPLVFITVSASLRSYAPSLELAAMTLGAGWWRTFRFVTLPMIRIGMVVGAIFAFATSFDELMLSLFLTSAKTRTLPRLIWEQMNDFLTPGIAAAATLILAFSLILLMIAVTARRGEARGGEGADPGVAIPNH